MKPEFSPAPKTGRPLRGGRSSAWPEDPLHASGWRWVGGIDEAGRGPLFGPVVAAVVVCDLHHLPQIAEIRDSKALNQTQRERAYYEILQLAQAGQLSYGIGQASAREIDQMDILRATLLAVGRALKAVPQWPQFLLTDALSLPQPWWTQRQCPLVKGDSRCLTIAAASIVAKVTRDKILHQYHHQYPQYGLARHKGYPTSEHYQALHLHGPTPHHRKTFLPRRSLLPAGPSQSSPKH